MSFDNKTQICIPLNEQTVDALVESISKAEQAADLIELRLDGLLPDEFQQLLPNLDNLISTASRPIILTFRAEEQGGYRALTREQRSSFWKSQLHSAAELVDIEADLVHEFTNHNENEQPDWSRVICSHHDFDRVPDNLFEIYEQLAFTPAHIVKLAVHANDVTDCLPVFKLIDQARANGREIIAIAMGDSGVITRILGPSRGAFLTYGASDFARGTAPGQIIPADLRSIYHVDQIDSATVITGLVGSPAMHSVSPHMHNAAFHAANQNCVYLPFDVKDLRGFVEQMVNPESRELDWNLRGLSITAPHKVEVMKYLDWIDPEADKIGAVNTIVLENEQLLGYNTDVQGFIEPLKRRMGSLEGTRAAVIGAGGAANAVIFALQRHGVDIDLYARDLQKASDLSNKFNISSKPLESARFAGTDIVVNTTPLGSFGAHVNESPASVDQLRGSRLVYDLVYNPIETRFLQQAREAGCEVLGGLEMLVAQAQLQFKIWTNTDASYELMYAAGSSALHKNFTHTT